MPKKEIIKLILRQLNQESSKDEREQFSNWLIDKPENLDDYIEIKSLWETPFHKETQFDDTRARQHLAEATRKSVRKRVLPARVWAVAASVLLLISFGVYRFTQTESRSSFLFSAHQQSMITKQSGPGEQLRVTLPDESVIWLNAKSSISFPEKFKGDFREVYLQGEAFFLVSKNPQRPFVVHTGSFTTTVLGTSFNIKAFCSQQTTVTVGTGKVRVENKVDDKTEGLYLLPNEQAVWNEQTQRFHKLDVNATNFYSWKDGTISFNNETLPESMRILERWYNVNIRLDLEKDSERHYINGNFKDKKLYNILDGLCYIYDLQYEYLNDNTIVITRK